MNKPKPRPKLKKSISEKKVSETLINEKANIIQRNFKKLFYPFVNRVSANIYDRKVYYNLLLKNLEIDKSKTNYCINLFKYDTDLKPIFRIGDKIILKENIRSDNINGLIYLSSFNDQARKIFKFAVRISKHTLNEPNIHLLLTKDVLNDKCPHFPITYEILSCNKLNESQKYIDLSIFPEYIQQNKDEHMLSYLIELANGDLKDFLNEHYNNSSFIENALAQIYFSLMFFYKKSGMFHNEANWHNFVFHKVKAGGYFHYKILGNDYYIENLGYLWVIQGFSTCDYFNKQNDMRFDFFKILHAFISMNDDIKKGWFIQDFNDDFSTKINNIYSFLFPDLNKATYFSYENLNIFFKYIVFIFKINKLIKTNNEFNQKDLIINKKPYIINPFKSSPSKSSSSKSAASSKSASSRKSASSGKSASSKPISLEVLNKKAHIIQRNIKKFLYPFVNRASADIYDRKVYYNLLLQKLKLSSKNTNYCMRFYKYDANGKPIFRIGDKLILKEKIGSDSLNGVVYLSSLRNKENKLFKFAIKISSQYGLNVSEILISLTKDVLDDICPHFPITYKILLCNNFMNFNMSPYLTSKSDSQNSLKKIKDVDLSIYPDYIQQNKDNVMLIYLIELANGDLKTFINQFYNNTSLVENALAQVLFSIMFFYRQTGLFHNDTHWGNFLFHKVKAGGYFHYKIFGKDYYIENLGYLWVIWDFDLCEYFNHSIDMRFDIFRIFHAFIPEADDIKKGWVLHDFNDDFTIKLNYIYKFLFTELDKIMYYSKQNLNIYIEKILFILKINNLIKTKKEINETDVIINKNPYIISPF